MRAALSAAPAVNATFPLACKGWFRSSAPPPNFLGVFIEGPSRVGHYFRPGYAPSKGGGDWANEGPLIRPNGSTHTWSLDYDPAANAGAGRIAVKLDDQSVSIDIKPDARKANASFNHFGMLTWDSGGNCVEIFFDDLQFTTAANKSTP